MTNGIQSTQATQISLPSRPSDAALLPQSAAPAPQTELSAISREAVNDEATSERVDTLLQGMQSWDDGGESKLLSGASKQAGSLSKIWEMVNRARNSPAVSRVGGAGGGLRAADPNQSRCQRLAGTLSSVGSGVGILPGVAPAGRLVQGFGTGLSLLGCPLLESESVQRVVRRAESRVQEVGRGMTEMVYGRDYDQDGVPDWMTPDRP